MRKNSTFGKILQKVDLCRFKSHKKSTKSIDNLLIVDYNCIINNKKGAETIAKDINESCKG